MKKVSRIACGFMAAFVAISMLAVSVGAITSAPAQAEKNNATTLPLNESVSVPFGDKSGTKYLRVTIPDNGTLKIEVDSDLWETFFNLYRSDNLVQNPSNVDPTLHTDYDSHSRSLRFDLGFVQRAKAAITYNNLSMGTYYFAISNSYDGWGDWGIFSGSCGLRATFTPNSVNNRSIVYHGNGSIYGTPPYDPNTYLAGSAVTVRGNTGNLVKSGFNFAGWNTAPNGLGQSYQPGTQFIVNANTILYAQWSPAPPPGSFPPVGSIFNSNTQVAPTASAPVSTPNTNYMLTVTLVKGRSLDLGTTADTATWSTSNSAVATVSSSGVVTARERGSATISATSGGQTIRIRVFVTET